MQQPNKQINVVLAEDHHIVRTAFAALLSREWDINVVGEVSDPRLILQVVEETTPHILILDAHMPGENVVNVAKKLREKFPNVRILVLSAYDQREYVVGFVRAGASGYVFKHDSSSMLIQAVRAVAKGEVWLSPRVTGILARSIRKGSQDSCDKLTERELEVLCLMCKGMRNDEIAKSLVITTQTVKNHNRHIFKKLGVDSRVDAVLYAIDKGLANIEISND